jgi:hypothetical protein
MSFNNNEILLKGSEQGNLTEGEGSVQLTSLYYLIRLAAIDIEHIVYFFTFFQNKIP